MMMLSIVLPPLIFPFHIVNFYSCFKYNESSKIEIICLKLRKDIHVVFKNI